MIKSRAEVYRHLLMRGRVHTAIRHVRGDNRRLRFYLGRVGPERRIAPDVFNAVFPHLEHRAAESSGSYWRVYTLAGGEAEAAARAWVKRYGRKHSEQRRRYAA